MIQTIADYDFLHAVQSISQQLSKQEEKRQHLTKAKDIEFEDTVRKILAEDGHIDFIRDKGHGDIFIIYTAGHEIEI